MIMDERLLFSDGQALTGTAASTNVVDLTTARQIGKGRPLYLVITLDVAADDTTGDETYSAQLQTDDNEAFSSAASLGGAITITRGDPAGTKYVATIPYENVERYLRINYTLGGTTPTVTLNAWLTDQEPESYENLPANSQ